MKRVIVCLLCALTLSACGPYRITYRMPSLRGRETETKTDLHSHGIGLIGGGGFFFAGSQMFPALADYTGEVDTRTICPDGFVEVSHYHTFWQQTVAAVISWAGVLNWWHASYIEWQCIKTDGSQSKGGEPGNR